MNARKWWKVPVILSAVFGFVPLMFIWMSGLYGQSQGMMAGLVVLLLLEGGTWLTAGIVMGVRRLRGRRIAAT